MDPVILILACITAFILFRLFSVMGTRTGHEQSHDLEALQRNKSNEQRLPDDVEERRKENTPPKPVSTNARVLREADPEFDELEYLSGARSAYEMIVEAFAAGDLRSIRSFLSEDVYNAFKQAVVAREEAGHLMDLKFVGIERAAIVDSDVEDGWMNAVTEFTSNQVRVTRDKEGNVVDGDPNRIDLVKDRWTFSRKRTSKDPNWILVATGGAQ
ncbi:MAG TPA: Tim44/TimA family putative adaptor protein [Hyphomicrobiales bacterium]|nr:Tim44/TimA family putative adaptor protein [Hyphomicrobiales bacterium]